MKITVGKKPNDRNRKFDDIICDDDDDSSTSDNIQDS